MKLTLTTLKKRMLSTKDLTSMVSLEAISLTEKSEQQNVFIKSINLLFLIILIKEIIFQIKILKD
jgi:hypothetical protein